MRGLLAIVPASLLAACAASGNAQEARLSGVEGSRSFNVSGFERVSLRGSDNVVVKVGPAASVTAKGDTAILDRLEIEVVNGELRVGREEGFRWRGDQGSALVTVTLPRLTAASVAGSGDMDVDRAEASSFDAAIAGSGNLRIASLTADAAEISIAGSGNATIDAGRGKSLDVSIAGSGNADAAGFRSERADISIAGSGNARAAVDGEADISIIGSGDAEIIGNARCQVSKMGSGDARCGNRG